MNQGFRKKRKFFFAPLILLALAVFSAVTMLLWNRLMPEIFSLPQIGFWQAAGLLVLGRLFFGGFRPGWKGRRGPWVGMELRSWLKDMSPEEREAFFRHAQNRRKHWRDTPGPNFSAGAAEPGE